MTRVDRAPLLVILLALLATLAMSRIARAQSPEAEVLFREGRKLIKAGKLEAGCDKLEASEKLETAVGTLLNLGDCREKLGRVASAWAAFRKAEALAKRRGRDEKRRNEAARRAQALESKLPYLAIMVNHRLDGLVVKRDGEVVDPVVWNTPVPLDPDTYTIVAEAPGYRPWRTVIRVNGKIKRSIVTVPVLEREPVATSPAAPQPPAVASPPPSVVYAPRGETTRTPSRWTTPRKIAVGMAGASAIAIGVGVYYGLDARDLEERSDELCPGSICDDPEGLRLNDRAQDAALRANIYYAIGGAALATSAVLWIVGAPERETVVTPRIGSDQVGVSFAGKF